MNDASKSYSVHVLLSVPELMTKDELDLIERHLGDLLAKVILDQDNEEME